MRRIVIGDYVEVQPPEHNEWDEPTRCCGYVREFSRDGADARVELPVSWCGEDEWWLPIRRLRVVGGVGD